MEQKGLLRRTHGGALPITQIENTDFKAVYQAANAANSNNIASIASKASSVIKEKDVIFINDPEICDFLIHSLPKDFLLTVVTNSLTIAQQLRPLSNIQVFLRGGEIDSEGNCLDILTIDSIKKMRFDKCFITSTSISAEFGISMTSSNSMNLLKAIIDSSKQSIGLYPSEKIGYESILSICPANKLDVLITNWDAPNDELKKFDKQGIRVITTDNPIEEDKHKD